MDDFFKSLKDNLENSPEPEFHESAWSRMELLLKPGKKRDLGLIFPWWIALLGSIFLFSILLNIYFLQRPSEGNQMSPIQTIDTVFQSEIHYQRDTVFVDRIIEKIVGPDNNSMTMSTRIRPRDFIKSLYLEERLMASTFNDKSPKQASFSVRDLHSGWMAFRAEKWEELSLHPNYQLTVLGPAPQLSANPIYPSAGNPELPFGDLLFVEKKFKRNVAQQLFAMRPKGLIMGIRGGINLPVREEIEEIKGVLSGVEAELFYNPQWRLFGELDYGFYKYSILEFNEELGVPAVDPPGDQYQLEKVENRQALLQYSFGLKYVFPLKGNLKPWVGIGITSTQLLKKELAYEFVHLTNGSELVIDSELSQSGIYLDRMLFKAGFEFPFANRWRWNLHGFYRPTLEEIPIPRIPAVGMQTGMSYEF